MVEKNKGMSAFRIINGFLLVMLCVLTIYPFLNQLAISLNEGTDTLRGGITIFPRAFTLDNYKLVLFDDEFWSAVVVSVLRVVITVILSLIVTFAAAYGLIKKGLAYKRGITFFLMIPYYITAGVIPIYMTYRYYGLINNFLVYIMPNLFVFYNMLIMRSFLQGIPDSLPESARIDGASEAVILFKIMLPVSMPVIATVALWTVVGGWNDWVSTLYYVTDRDLYTLQYLMMQMIKEAEASAKLISESAMTGVDISNVAKPTSESVTAATVMCSTLPIICVYPFLQKYFISGVTLGAVKG